MKVEKGKCVALIGESGCGKSGSNATLWEMRDMIGYVPQEPYLYGVSIAENIAYGRSTVMPEEVPMEEIVEAAKTANAHDFIMKLPNGYDTIPGEWGNTLSGGEKQRIAMADEVVVVG